MTRVWLEGSAIDGSARRRYASVAAGLLVAGLCGVAFAGCAPPPSPGPREAGGPGPPGVSAPRFGAGGPDAEEYGASNGYPIGARGTFLRPPFRVGSHSHHDQIFRTLGIITARRVRPEQWTIAEGWGHGIPSRDAAVF